MKLAKALKEKNRLAGEVGRLKALIQRENSRNVKSSSKIDVSVLWDEMEVATEKLIELKTAIFIANKGIYKRIVRIAELKGKVSWVSYLNTNDEKTEQPYGASGTILVVEHRAYKTQEDVDNMVKSLNEEIAVLQDDLDEYNATVSI